MEKLGRSLLGQFDGVEFIPVTLPFVNMVGKVRAAVQQINMADIPMLDVTVISVEEIATSLLHLTGLERR